MGSPEGRLHWTKRTVPAEKWTNLEREFTVYFGSAGSTITIERRQDDAA